MAAVVGCTNVLSVEVQSTYRTACCISTFKIDSVVVPNSNQKTLDHMVGPPNHSGNGSNGTGSNLTIVVAFVVNKKLPKDRFCDVKRCKDGL